MNRRNFLETGVVLSRAAAWPRTVPAQQDATASSDPGWRRFEVTSRMEILKPEGVTQAWLPLPCVDAPDWVRNHGDSWSGNGDSVQVFLEEKFGASMHARPVACGRRGPCHRGHQPHLHPRPGDRFFPPLQSART